MTIYEIPLLAQAQSLRVTLAGVEYLLTLGWRDAPDAGWQMDIAAADGTPILAGVPLVTGADLLAQYRYLGIGGALYVGTDGDTDAVPTYVNLGGQAHLYWVPDA